MIRAIAIATLAAAGLAFSQGMGSATKAIARPSPVRGVKLPEFDFRDIAGELGLDAKNVYGGESTKRYILEMTGNGVVAFDSDNDGWQDLFFVNGSRLDGTSGINRLYRNREGKGFEDVTARSGLGRSGWGQGACAGDFNGDGKMDLFVTYYGTNVVYRNEGEGRFRAMGVPAGSGARWSTGCALLDYDRDGDLDIFAANYVVFDLKGASAPGANPFCYWRALAVFCGPRGMQSGRNILYRNDGDRFTDVSKQAGIEIEGLHYGLGAIASDFDDDGWPDIYVACDSTPGILYRNRGDGTFQDIAVEAGAAYGEAGQEQGSMGVAAADYDDDGRIDIVKTNFMDETAALYHNEGDRFFTDTTLAAGLGYHTKFVGWGVEFFDADQDGRKDIVMANGHIYPEMESSKTAEKFRQSRLFYWNAGKGMFADATMGDLLTPWSSRGLAVADLDNDGALEVIVVNMNGTPSVYRNKGRKGNAIVVEARPAIGSRIRVTVNGRQQVVEPHAGSSYASQSDLRAHFGLGEATGIDELEIRWPDGKIEKFGAAAANEWVVVEKGKGVVNRRSLRR